MFIAQLGRQPELSLAELSSVFGDSAVTRVATEFATIASDHFNLDILGGTIKYGEIVSTLPPAANDTKALTAATRYISSTYRNQWQHSVGKLTLGISTYNIRVSPRAVQKIGLILKSSLKPHGVNLRLIPNTETALSTATSHNNRLGTSDRKIELLIIKKTNGEIVIAESRGVQNITAYTRRDRQRPKRDAFVGMLPPKLAQIMLNLATRESSNRTIILDPFCGTGTVLQEALLQDYSVLGSDLSGKMVSYTKENLNWLQEKFHTDGTVLGIEQADATTFTWSTNHTIGAVVCETYLGQPFSAPPSPAKLKEVVGNCNHIISSFIKNIHPQLQSGTPLCIAIPAWQNKEGQFTHLPLIRRLHSLGYERIIDTPLLYHRPGQVVAREILVLKTV